MHSKELLEFGRQLMGFLPFCSKLGSFLVKIVVGKILSVVWVEAKGPKPVQVDFITNRGCKGVHQDTCAESLGGQMLVFPVPAK